MNFESTMVNKHLLEKRNLEIHMGIRGLCEGREFKDCIYLGEFLERWNTKIEINNDNDLIALVYSVLLYGTSKDANTNQLTAFAEQCITYLNESTITNAFGLTDETNNEETRSIIYFGLYCFYKKHQLVGISDISKKVESMNFENFTLENQILIVFAANLYAEEELDELLPKLSLSDELFVNEDTDTLTTIKILGLIYGVISEYKIKVSTQLKKKLMCCRDLSQKEEKNPDKYTFVDKEQVIKLNYMFLSRYILQERNNLGTPATNRVVTRYIQLYKEKGKLDEVLSQDYVRSFLENTLSNFGKKYLSEFKIEYTDFEDLLNFLQKIIDISRTNNQCTSFMREFFETDYLYLLKDYDFNNINTNNYALVLLILENISYSYKVNIPKDAFDCIFRALDCLYKNNLIQTNPIEKMLNFPNDAIMRFISRNNLVNPDTKLVLNYSFGNFLDRYIRFVSKENMEECLNLMTILTNEELNRLLTEGYNLHNSPFEFRTLAEKQSLNRNFYDIYFRFFKSKNLFYFYQYLMISNLDSIYKVYDFSQEEKDLLETEINTNLKNFNHGHSKYINYLINNFDRVVKLMNYSTEEQLNIKKKLYDYGYREEIEDLYTEEEKHLIGFDLLKDKISKAYEYSFIKNNIQIVINYKEKNPERIKEIEELKTVFENRFENIAKSKDYSCVDIKEYFMLKNSNLFPNIVSRIEEYYKEII